MNPNILTPLKVQKDIKDPFLKGVLWLSIEKNACCTLKGLYHVHILLINKITVIHKRPLYSCDQK